MSGFSFGISAVLVIVVLALVLYAVFGSGRVQAVVDFTRRIAIVALVSVGFAIIAQVVSALSDPQVQLEVPVEPYWPEYPHVTDVSPDHGGNVTAQINEVLITSGSLSAGTRVLLATGALCEGLAVCAVILSVILLCNKLRVGKPFTASLRKTARVVATILGFGTTLGQILNGFGASFAGEESLHIDSFVSTAQSFEASSPWPEPTFAIYFEFNSLFIALGVFVVAELVTAGLRLTEQNNRLTADTEGLV
ncbi:hypothetical protein ACTXJX_11295 [Glutamicibacter ardleyensis]|uniref:hypothetical protein n=1 Tax=Glutamicibacter ardleyensis TaxID=225894 RepID=UPI003FD1D4D5